MGDTETWKKITEGDRDAFGVLYRQCALRLRVFLRRLLINEQTAEDVMQNTFTETGGGREGTIPRGGVCVRIYSEWRVNRPSSGGVNNVRKTVWKSDASTNPGNSIVPHQTLLKGLKSEAHRRSCQLSQRFSRSGQICELHLRILP